MDGCVDCTNKCQIAFARSHEEFFRVCENDNVVIVELVPFDKTSAAYIYTESVDDPYACYTMAPDYRKNLHRKISESLNEFKCVNRNF